MLFAASLILALIFTWAIILTNDFHGHFTHDHDMEGDQKYHDVPTPRIGGIPILLSFVFGLTILKISGITYAASINLLIPILVVFMAGLLEDLTKVITPLERTLFFVIALIVAIYLTNSLTIITRTGFVPIDTFIFNWPSAGVILTFIGIIGLTNAYNVIDGYHGLATIAASINLLGLAITAYIVNDVIAAKMILGILGSLLGFLYFNYPKGRIFLGDGGAYMIGFIIAVSSVKLTQLWPGAVSPYAPLLMAIYPIVEVIFSIYRKRFLRHTPASKPDGLHLHMLIYKRCTSYKSSNRNPAVVLIMLCLIVPQVILGIIFHKSNIFCIIFVLIYIITYIYIYFKIVRFKTPALLKSVLKK